MGIGYPVYIAIFAFALAAIVLNCSTRACSRHIPMRSSSGSSAARGATQARADAYGVPAYTGVDELLERARPDLVTVCLPNEDHFEPTLALLRAQVPLLVDKPLVFELEQADALLAEAERHGTFFAINFNHRYARPVRMAADAIAQGTLGELVFASWRFGGEPGPASTRTRT